MSEKIGFIKAYPDRLIPLHTTRTLPSLALTSPMEYGVSPIWARASSSGSWTLSHHHPPVLQRRGDGPSPHNLEGNMRGNMRIRVFQILQ
ncbi:hypothetical protein QJS04_geneDACA018768 [Acorus gramineus]|uniref:Uncharacterized protein n=1 Tax=Acorus gramineus TaxID=55184 RepID=A0AAV9ABV6_ACOGR|nr:hypothetical protein QJS04_geneDACA018768 [Acorus gramineus]